MAKYYSIRVIEASNHAEAVEKVENQEFFEEHPLCDKVMKKETLKSFLDGENSRNESNPKSYWFAVSEHGKSWNECTQVELECDSWADAVSTAYSWASKNNTEIRMSESAGFNNQGHFFHPAEL